MFPLSGASYCTANLFFILIYIIVKLNVLLLWCISIASIACATYSQCNFVWSIVMDFHFSLYSLVSYVNYHWLIVRYYFVSSLKDSSATNWKVPCSKPSRRLAGLRDPTSLRGSRWPSGRIWANTMIDIRLVRLSLWEWLRVGHGAAKKKKKKMWWKLKTYIETQAKYT